MTDHLAERTGTTSPALRRLHPLTPLLRSWQLVGVATAIFLASMGDEIDRWEWAWDAVHGDADLPLLIRAGLVVIAVAAVLLAAGWVSWRVTGYALVADDREGRGEAGGTLLYHRGVFVRQRSRVRLDRVQSVDVLQPFVPRLLGLAVVSVEMAAGSEASVKLAYLREADAWKLRDEILHFTPTGGAGAAAPRAGRADQQLVARVSTTRLVQAAVLEGGAVWVLLMLVLVASVVVLLIVGRAALVAVLPALVSVFIGLLIAVQRQVSTVLREANFTLLRTHSGIRISSGLLSTLNRTVELDRVQEIRIVEPWSWRWFDWARVEIDIAGSRATDDTAPAATLMPVADRREADEFVTELLGARLDQPGLAPPGKSARWLDPLGYRFLGVGLLDQGALSRLGRWRQRRVFVPYARVQSVSVRQGWLQRLLGLATVHLDMPGGVRRWSAPHRELPEARSLVDELVQRARLQRAAPWSQPALHPGDGRSDHKAEHDAAHQLGPGVEGGPGEVREPGHEDRDHAESYDRDRHGGGQPDHHQHQDHDRDDERWQRRQPQQDRSTDVG